MYIMEFLRGETDWGYFAVSPDMIVTKIGDMIKKYVGNGEVGEFRVSFQENIKLEQLYFIIRDLWGIGFFDGLKRLVFWEDTEGYRIDSCDGDTIKEDWKCILHVFVFESTRYIKITSCINDHVVNFIFCSTRTGNWNGFYTVGELYNSSL